MRTQVTPEATAHLQEAGVAVKPYEGLLEDVRALASAGSTILADPAKARPSCMVLDVSLDCSTLHETAEFSQWGFLSESRQRKVRMCLGSCVVITLSGQQTRALGANGPSGVLHLLPEDKRGCVSPGGACYFAICWGAACSGCVKSLTSFPQVSYAINRAGSEAAAAAKQSRKRSRDDGAGAPLRLHNAVVPHMTSAARITPTCLYGTEQPSACL